MNAPISMRALTLAALLLLAGGLAPAAGAHDPGVLLVGYEPGAPAPASVSAAGDVLALDPALGLAIVRAPDADAALASLAADPAVQFAERDGAVHAQAVGADSSRWDSSRWDSSRWDSSRWDALTLDSSRWDSSRWDSSRWDSSRWDSSRWDGSALVADPLLRYQWGLADLNVPDAWAIDVGHMTRTLCVVDSGVDYTHPDLAPQMWTAADGTHGWSFVGNNADPMDDAGHGTNVAGIAAAAVGNGLGTAGVANAKIMAVKVLDGKGVGGEGNLARGIQWCADHGANVISMSLSGDQSSQAVARAVQYAQAKGALLIASAGNVGKCGCPAYPAAYPGVMGVAAIDMARQHAGFSRQGSWADVVAPGELIAGPYLGHDYALGTGTSQATALVAGVALLGWDHAPSLTADQLQAKILATAQTTPGGEKEPDAAALLRALG
ncbi:MAG: hypothetical protein QOE90_270 [Thermoplasmata archaeon]|jgi:hypothetical protein|nr:hypothetical protein [Thermoplasmata archaeon]